MVQVSQIILSNVADSNKVYIILRMYLGEIENICSFKWMIKVRSTLVHEQNKIKNIET